MASAWRSHTRRSDPGGGAPAATSWSTAYRQPRSPPRIFDIDLSEKTAPSGSSRSVLADASPAEVVAVAGAQELGEVAGGRGGHESVLGGVIGRRPRMLAWKRASAMTLAKVVGPKWPVGSMSVSR